MTKHIGLNLLRIGDHKGAFGCIQLTRIPHLPAGLRIKRRAVQNYDASLATVERRYRCALAIDRDHFGIANRHRVITLELRFGAGVFHRAAHLKLGCLARAFTLVLHRRFKARVIHAHMAFTCNVGSEIDRETKGVIQLEHGVAIEHLVFTRQRGFQHLHAVFECFSKAFFLLLQHTGYALVHFDQLRVGLAHGLHQIGHDVVEEGFGLTQLVTMAYGAADDAAQHITTPFVTGYHAIDDQERTRADVIGDDLQRVICQILAARFARGGLDQILK